MQEDKISPVPNKLTPKTLGFPMAMAEVIDGKRIARQEWGNADYCLLKDGWLMICRDGKFHQWLVNDGDMLATDWIVLPALN